MELVVEPFGRLIVLHSEFHVFQHLGIRRCCHLGFHVLVVDCV